MLLSNNVFHTLKNSNPHKISSFNARGLKPGHSAVFNMSNIEDTKIIHDGAEKWDFS